MDSTTNSTHPTGDHAADHPEAHHGLTPMGYLIVLVFLLGMTGLTYYTGKYVTLPGSWNLVLAMVIAVIKATTVCAFFMHLKGDTRANQLIVLVSVCFVLLLMGMTILDIQTRFPQAAPPGSLRARADPRGTLD